MIILERFLDHSREPEIGCLGEIYIDGEFVCYTIEKPWRQNKRFISCVPAGEYELKHFYSPKYGETFALSNPELNVVANKEDADNNDRYACLFHAANWAAQLQGCIAPGQKLSWGEYNGVKNMMVTNSRKALDLLLPELENRKLLIQWKTH